MGSIEDKWLEETKAYVPNIAALHSETKYQAYREFIPRKGKVEVTIFYREPGESKMRIDAEFDEGLRELSPDKVRITYWGSAVGL